MSDQKDPGIKLFGRVIPLAPEPAPGTAEAEEPPRPDQPPEELQPPAPEEEAAADEDQHNEKQEKEDSEMKVDTPQQEKDNEMKVDAAEEKKENEMKVDVQQEKEDKEMKVEAPQITENMEPDSSSTSDSAKDDQDHKKDRGQMNSAEDKAVSDPKGENEKTTNDESGQDKALKKPDKILPCPRCNSMDTKFCYYNNYNVNQPRHFCKNCQRYWTAGGTMRNVPVGAGRRKSKNSSLHYRQLLMAPDCMMGSRVDISKSVLSEALVSSPSAPIQTTNRNETVLKFGPEVPLCESMVSALNIDDQNATNVGSAPRRQNREDSSSAPSVTSYNGLPETAVHVGKNGAPVYCNGVTPVPQYYLGAPFMYPWSVGWKNLPVMVPSMPESAPPPEGCSTSSAPWMNSPMMPASRLPGPAFPYPLMPPALWGCLSGWPATTWNIPWIRTSGCVSPSSSSNSSCSGNGSPTLGKHSSFLRRTAVTIYLKDCRIMQHMTSYIIISEFLINLPLNIYTSTITYICTTIDHHLLCGRYLFLLNTLVGTIAEVEITQASPLMDALSFIFSPSTQTNQQTLKHKNIKAKSKKISNYLILYTPMNIHTLPLSFFSSEEELPYQIELGWAGLGKTWRGMARNKFQRGF